MFATVGQIMNDADARQVDIHPNAAGDLYVRVRARSGATTCQMILANGVRAPLADPRLMPEEAFAVSDDTLWKIITRQEMQHPALFHRSPIPGQAIVIVDDERFDIGTPTS